MPAWLLVQEWDYEPIEESGGTRALQRRSKVAATDILLQRDHVENTQVIEGPVSNQVADGVDFFPLECLRQ